jgi:hypothetical protein
MIALEAKQDFVKSGGRRLSESEMPWDGNNDEQDVLETMARGLANFLYRSPIRF